MITPPRSPSPRVTPSPTHTPVVVQVTRTEPVVDGRTSDVFARSFQQELAISHAYTVLSCISSEATLPQTQEGTVSDFFMTRRGSQATEVPGKLPWYKRLLERLRPLFIFNKSVGSAMQGIG